VSVVVGKPIRYVVDLRTSRFTVRAFAGGMLSAIGHNPTFAVRDYMGEVRFDPETGDGAAVSLRIKAASLEVTTDVSSKDRQEIEQTMRDDVLESDRYADIIYDCPTASTKRMGDGQYELTLNGSMTLHGVTRPQPIAAKVVVSPSMLRTFGEFTISQQQYGIKPVTFAGGTLKVKDELQCAFDIVARP
jgi:polyisoprenoid-binding protein YceI